MSWVAASAFRMFVLFAYFVAVAMLVVACEKWLPDGWLKRLLLMDVDAPLRLPARAAQRRR